MRSTLSSYTVLRTLSRGVLPGWRIPYSRPLRSLPPPLLRQPTSSFSTSSPFFSKPLTDRQSASATSSHKPASIRPPQPEYQITFTCTPCSTRSTHRISKQGYHHGSVLIKCPECQNRHVISDHLKIFGDKNMTIEDIMRERGQSVKKGTLSEDGDLEFWEDGTASNSEGSNGDDKGVLIRGKAEESEDKREK